IVRDAAIILLWPNDKCGVVAHRSAERSTPPTTARWAVALDNSAWRPRGFERADRRDLNNVFGIVVDKLEPILRDVRRRKDVVLSELGDEGELEIVFANPLLLPCGDGAL